MRRWESLQRQPRTLLACRSVEDLSVFVGEGDGSQQGTRTMSAEDQTGGFHNLSMIQQRDERFSQEIAKVVHDNAVLLNAVVSRVNAVEAAAVLAQQQSKEQSEKTDTLTADTRKALSKLEGTMDERESGLRKQLSAMATRLEEGHSELETRIGQSGQGAQTAGSASVRELGAIAERRRYIWVKRLTCNSVLWVRELSTHVHDWKSPSKRWER